MSFASSTFPSTTLPMENPSDQFDRDSLESNTCNFAICNKKEDFEGSETIK